MSVYRRGSRFYYDFMINGRRYRAAVPSAQTKKQAEHAEAVARQEVFDGTYGRPRGSAQFKQFVEQQYLPWAKVNNRAFGTAQVMAKLFVAYFHDKTLADFNQVIIERFKRDRLSTPTRSGTQRKPASVNCELAYLSKILSLAVEQHELAENPCRWIKSLRADNHRTRYLTPEEEERLMPVLEFYPTLKVIVQIALNTGMRCGEILKLKWSEVDFSRGLILVRETKSGRDRSIPINTRLVTALESLAPCSHLSPWLFPAHSKTGHLMSVRGSWLAVLEAAGITGLHFHDLRHTAATRLGESGATAFEIAAILGHSSIQMSARYTHTSSDRLHQAVEKLATKNNCLNFVAKAAAGKG